MIWATSLGLHTNVPGDKELRNQVSGTPGRSSKMASDGLEAGAPSLSNENPEVYMFSLADAPRRTEARETVSDQLILQQIPSRNPIYLSVCLGD